MFVCVATLLECAGGGGGLCQDTLVKENLILVRLSWLNRKKKLELLLRQISLNKLVQKML